MALRLASLRKHVALSRSMPSILHHPHMMTNIYPHPPILILMLVCRLQAQKIFIPQAERIFRPSSLHHLTPALINIKMGAGGITLCIFLEYMFSRCKIKGNNSSQVSACFVRAIHTSIHTYIHTHIPTYIHSYTHTCMHTCIHACLHACMRACMPIHTITCKSMCTCADV